MERVKYGKLRGRIIEYFGRYNAFAKETGMSNAVLAMRLSGKSQWKQQEILKVCELLEIDKADVCDYFFSE